MQQTRPSSRLNAMMTTPNRSGNLLFSQASRVIIDVALRANDTSTVHAMKNAVLSCKALYDQFKDDEDVMDPNYIYGFEEMECAEVFRDITWEAENIPASSDSGYSRALMNESLELLVPDDFNDLLVPYAYSGHVEVPEFAVNRLIFKDPDFSSTWYTLVRENLILSEQGNSYEDGFAFTYYVPRQYAETWFPEYVFGDENICP